MRMVSEGILGMCLPYIHVYQSIFNGTFAEFMRRDRVTFYNASVHIHTKIETVGIKQVTFYRPKKNDKWLEENLTSERGETLPMYVINIYSPINLHCHLCRIHEFRTIDLL